jgi:molybdopterin-containing oxidoreductase family iron-sulfur binding subunit
VFNWSYDFGDINVKESPIAKLVADDRMYHLLEHVETKPNVIYHVKVSLK